MSISLSVVNEVIDVALQVAKESAAAPLAIVVIDDGGHLKAVQRQDGASILRTDIAFAKAWGALGMGQPSRLLAERAAKQEQFFASLLQIAQGRMALAPGGVLCVDDRGRIVGAVGISGDAPDVDERCAIAGIEKAGLRAIASADDLAGKPASIERAEK